MYFTVSINGKDCLLDADFSPYLTLQDVLHLAAQHLNNNKWVEDTVPFLGTAPTVSLNGYPWKETILIRSGLVITVEPSGLLTNLFGAKDRACG